MNKLKVMTIAALTILVAGCEHVPKIPRITVFKPIEIPNVQPTPLSLRTVEWDVYTLAELRTFVDEQEAAGVDPNTVYYVLPKGEYDNLAYNLAELRRFIEDQRATNTYLVEAIEINNGDREEHSAPALTAEPEAE